MAEIGLAASIIAVIQITASVTTRAFKYGESVKNAKQDIVKIQEQLKDLERILEKLKDLANEATKVGRPVDSWPALRSLSSPDGALEQCKLAMMALDAQLAPVEGARFAKYKNRALWPSKRKSIERCLEDIRAQKNILVELLNAEHIGQSLKTGHMVSDISKSQSDSMRDKIIQWLSHTDPNSNQIAARRKHEKETGKWFTEGKDYLQWKQNPGSFLWLYGIPGCGKTVLCSEIIEKTREYCADQPADRVLAYFYFSFRDAEKQKTDNLLCSILSQLVCQENYIPDAVHVLYDNYGKSRPPTDRLLSAIKPLVDGTRNVFIIIDALDECPDDNGERNHLCEILTEINEWATGSLNILVTGRREVDLDESLGPLCSTRPISIEGAAVQHDIQKFVRAQLSKDRKLQKWQKAIKDEIEQALVEGAHGMFRWVDCQLDSLKRCITPSDVRKALRSLPKTLDETYERILMSIAEEHQEKALVALQWISHACQPIMIDELAEAVIIDPAVETLFDPYDRIPNPNWLQEILSGLVVVSKRLRYAGSLHEGQISAIEIAHFSVKEYLNSSRICTSPIQMFSISEASSIEGIIQRSLLYIKWYSMSDSKLTYSENPAEFPLLEWASLLWYEHLLAVEDLSTTTSDMVLDFLTSETSMSTWLLIHATHRLDDEFSKVAFPTIHPLHYATLFGSCSLVRHIISKGADVNAESGNLGTALHVAAQHKPLSVMKVLLEAGADINSRSDALGTVLQVAAYRGSADVVEFLIGAGADVNMHGGELTVYGTALQAAIVLPRSVGAATVEVLLAAGADVNTQGGIYGSPLHAAVRNKDTEAIKILLDAGADVNADIGEHRTALYTALRVNSIWWPHWEVVRLLLEAGADTKTLGDVALETLGHMPSKMIYGD